MQIHAQETGIQSQVMKEKFQHADVYNSLLIGVYLLWKRAQYTLRLRKGFSGSYGHKPGQENFYRYPEH